MISYTRLTLRQVIEDVFVRGEQHINPENADWSTVVRYVNQAVKEITLLAYNFKKESYIKREQFSYLETGYALNPGIIQLVRVLFTVNSDYSGPWVEGRYAAPREFYAVGTGDSRIHSWNKYTTVSPVYTLWGSKSPWVAASHIGTSYPSIYYSPDTMYGIMEYYGFPAEAQEADDTIMVPYGFEDYIVLSCLYRLYSRTGVQDAATLLFKRIEAERAAMLKVFEKGKVLEKKEVDNFMDAVMPMGDKK